MPAASIVEYVTTGTDSIEIGDYKSGRVKINFTPEESQSEQRANDHIDRMARQKARALQKLSGIKPAANAEE